MFSSAQSRELTRYPVMTAKGQKYHSSVDDLLATKLEVPLLGPRIVPRPRLTKLLIESMKKRACLIVAPTGYGKTTLLGEWLSFTLPADWRIAWITLDSFDNDPLRFWSYISASLQKVCSRSGSNLYQVIQIGNDPENYQLLTPFINAIARIPYQICLVLDDYQNIKDPRIHQGMTYLLDHQPNQMHLVISSRVAPPIPFTRLRAQMQVIDISASDLSFTTQEVNTYLSGMMSLQVDNENVIALQNATEGWIAGLQLAALSLQNRFDIHRLISDLPGGNRQIFEYLTEEVLIHQDAEIKEFLLKTSVLPEMTAPLCDNLLERDNSREILDLIKRSNLFLVSLDDQKRWFRYHHLFAEVLQQQLKESYPDLIPELHRKACRWFSENGYPDKAVSHALEAGELEMAAEIIDSSAFQAVIGFDLDKLIYSIGRFSPDLLTQRPRLGIYQALANYLLWRMDRVEPILHALDNTLQHARGKGISEKEARSLRWEIDALRACITCVNQDPLEGIEQVFRLRQCVPEGEVYFPGLMTHAQAEAYASIYFLDRAAEEYLRGARFAEENALIQEYFYSISEMAHVRKLQGKLAEADRIYHMLLEYDARHNLNPMLAAFATTGLAEIRLAKNELPASENYINQVIHQLPQLDECPLTYIRYEWILIRITNFYLAIGNLDLAAQYFEKALSIYREETYACVLMYSELIRTRVRLWDRQGKLSNREYPFLAELNQLNPMKRESLEEMIALVRIYLAQSRPQDSLHILQQVESICRDRQICGTLLEVLILKCLAFDYSGRENEAEQALLDALRMGEPEGFVQFFIEEKSRLQPILERMKDKLPEIKNLPEWQFALDILGLYQKAVIELPVAAEQKTQTTSALAPILEPLSQREMEVLSMLVSGKSTKEVATELMISINTAKTHAKSVYRKLGSHNRLALSRRAEELGLFK